jgi:lipoprotein NlpD
LRASRSICTLGLCCLLLCACADTGAGGPENYVVRPGDTLYSIAWRHDLDFRDLARWNNIGADFRISVGQVLVLGPGRESPAGRAAPRTAPRPAPAPGPAPAPAVAGSRAPETPQVSKPRPLPESPGTGPPNSPTTANTASPSGRRSTPSPSPPNGRDAPALNSPSLNGPAGEAREAPGVANGGLRWVWPTDRAGAPRPVPGGGILLSGRLGQDVRAASAGRVVYAGSGLRGYGNLIIIKHADSVLSAYAHNREMLVRDGQEVAMGQVIAHMGQVIETGKSPQQSAILYFEIRQNGRPVDPLPFLPKTK